MLNPSAVRLSSSGKKEGYSYMGCGADVCARDIFPRLNHAAAHVDHATQAQSESRRKQSAFSRSWEQFVGFVLKV